LTHGESKPNSLLANFGIGEPQTAAVNRGICEKPRRRGHKWTQRDDLVAFYVSRHGTGSLRLTGWGLSTRIPQMRTLWHDIGRPH